MREERRRGEVQADAADDWGRETRRGEERCRQTQQVTGGEIRGEEERRGEVQADTTAAVTPRRILRHTSAGQRALVRALGSETAACVRPTKEATGGGRRDAAPSPRLLRLRSEQTGRKVGRSVVTTTSAPAACAEELTASARPHVSWHCSSTPQGGVLLGPVQSLPPDRPRGCAPRAHPRASAQR